MLKFVSLVALFGVALGAPAENTLNYAVGVNQTLGIVGGSPADISQFPWQVSVQYLQQHFCGGILIAPTWVLTAAHCLTQGYVTNLNIRAGSTQRGSGGQVSIVDGYVIHPNYRDATLDSDIALLRLSTPVNAANARAAVLPPDNQEVLAGNTLTVTGWGTTSENGASSQNLLQVSVPVIGRQQCTSSYAAMRQITNTMICAGLLGQGGRDACQGDSGGPAVVSGQVVGIVSWGAGCGRPQYPGVYAHVSVFRSWIRQYTGL